MASFANASGGGILYGVAEADGGASELPGIRVQDLDAAVRRLDGILSTGIAPRIAGLRYTPVAIDGERAVLVLTIPRSWTAPHMVIVGNGQRFVVRRANGKSQMDIAEIRTAVMGAGTVVDRLQAFRADRLGRILASDTPLPMPPGPLAVLHVLPLSAADGAARVDLGPAERYDAPQPLWGAASHDRFNLDGRVYSAWPSGTSQGVTAYAQLFRTGAIESVGAREEFVLAGGDLPRSVASDHVELAVVRRVREYRTFLAKRDVVGPFVVGLALLGVRGLGLRPAHLRHNVLATSHRQFDRDEVVLPDILIEDGVSDEQLDRALRPLFDTFWNAAGWAHSYNYGPDGCRLNA